MNSEANLGDDLPPDAPRSSPKLAPGATVRGRLYPAPRPGRQKQLVPLFRKGFSKIGSPKPPSLQDRVVLGKGYR